ncbi:MAG: YveK family protein, partial [Anaerobutyricum soehngenii]
MKSEAGKGLEGVKMETNEKRNVPDDDVIDLREIFFAIKRKIFLIIAVGLLCGCLYGAYTAFLIDPVYTSTASVLVLSKETTLTSIADLQLGSQLAADYQVLIKSTSVMEDVIDALDLEMTPEALRASITINNPVDTRILEVSVVNTDGELAKKITDKVVEVSSE